MTTKITEVKNEPIRKYFSEDRFDIGRLDFAMGVKADGTCDYIIDTPSQIPMSKSDADLIRKLKAMPSMGVAVVDYGNKAKAMLSNETNFVEAFLNPELIVILSDYDF